MTDTYYNKTYSSTNPQGRSNSSYNLRSGSNPNNNPSPAATEAAASSSTSEKNFINSPQQGNTVDVPSLNEETLDVVEKLKNKITEKLRLEQLQLTEDTIEWYVSHFRRASKSKQFNMNEWKTCLGPEFFYGPDEAVKRLAAYGDNPDEVKPILQAKLKKNDVQNGAASIDKPIKISLEGVISPLKDLYKKMSKGSSYDLFDAVLQIPSNQYDRADRMFYSEASQLMKNPTNYKIEHAHDQVEAIRLTHYTSDNMNRLMEFITEYRTFDDAYKHLQYLSKKGTNTSATTTTISTRVSSARGSSHSGSIVREAKNNDSSSNPTTPSSSGNGDSPTSAYGYSTSTGRPPSATSRPESSRHNRPNPSEGSNSYPGQSN